MTMCSYCGDARCPNVTNCTSCYAPVGGNCVHGSGERWWCAACASGEATAKLLHNALHGVPFTYGKLRRLDWRDGYCPEYYAAGYEPFTRPRWGRWYA